MASAHFFARPGYRTVSLTHWVTTVSTPHTGDVSRGQEVSEHLFSLQGNKLKLFSDPDYLPGLPAASGTRSCAICRGRERGRSPDIRIGCRQAGTTQRPSAV